MELNSVCNWILENIVAIIAAGISGYAIRKSSKANQIAQEANDLVKLDLEYSQDQNKKEKIKKIIDSIVSNWKKERGAQGVLCDEWETNKEILTIVDFNNMGTSLSKSKRSTTQDDSRANHLKMRIHRT